MKKIADFDPIHVCIDRIKQKFIKVFEEHYQAPINDINIRSQDPENEIIRLRNNLGNIEHNKLQNNLAICGVSDSPKEK